MENADLEDLESQIFSEYVAKRMKEKYLSDEELARLAKLGRSTVLRARLAQVLPHRRTIAKLIKILDGELGFSSFEDFANQRKEYRTNIKSKMQMPIRSELPARHIETEPIGDEFLVFTEGMSIEISSGIPVFENDTIHREETYFQFILEELDIKFGNLPLITSFDADDHYAYALWVKRNILERIFYFQSKIDSEQSVHKFGEELASLYCYYAENSLDLRCHDQEILAIERAIQIRKRIYEKFSMRTAATLILLSDVCVRRGNISKAKDIFREIIMSIEHNVEFRLESSECYLGTFYNPYISFLILEGRIDKAEALLFKSISVLQKQIGNAVSDDEINDHIANALIWLVEMFHEQGDEDRANEIFMDAVHEYGAHVAVRVRTVLQEQEIEF